MKNCKMMISIWGLISVLSPLSIIAQVNPADMLIYRDLAVGYEHVWLASSKGLVRVNKSVGEEKVFKSEKFTDLCSVVLSPDETVYCGNYGRSGIGILEGDSFSPLPNDGISPVDISALCFTDNLWVGASLFLGEYNGQEWKSFPILDPFAPYAASYNFDAIAYDSQRQYIWFGISSTTFDSKFGWIDENDEIHYVQEATSDVFDVCVQPSGAVLLATDSGMMKYQDGEISILEHPFTSISRSSEAVVAHGNTIWFAAGNTLVRGIGTDFQAFTCPDVEENDIIMDLALDGNVVWVLFREAGAFAFRNDTFSRTASVNDIISDPEPTHDTYTITGVKTDKLIKGSVYIRDGKKFIAE